MMQFCILFLKTDCVIKQNKVKDDKVHQLFLISSLHSEKPMTHSVAMAWLVKSQLKPAHNFQSDVTINLGKFDTVYLIDTQCNVYFKLELWEKL